MLAEQRHRRIAELLRRRGTVSTTELMRLLGVSRETVRRDLEELEARGVLRRVHGGAAGTTASEPPWAERAAARVVEKRAIGAAAAALVARGEAIMLDLGTTCLEVARHLKDHTDLTVLTNSVPAALELVQGAGVRVFLTGGLLRSGDLSLSGPLTRSSITQHLVDTVIIGAGGLTLAAGVTDYHVDEAEARRQMIAHASRVVVVADHTKFGVTAFTRVVETAAIDTIVTDSGASEEVIEPFRAAGVEVIVAPVSALP